MSKLTSTILVIALVSVVAAAAYLLLQACGVGAWGTSRFLGFCPSSVAVQERQTLVTLNDETNDLQRRIAFLERELAAKQCTAQYSVPEPVLPQSSPETIDDEAWNQRDLRVLEGCWELDSLLEIINDRTRAVTTYRKWSMCFNGSGRGTQDMVSTDGAVACTGPVTGHFDSAGQLIIEEPTDLPCSDNGVIWRRVTSCVLNNNGTASCVSHQPEHGNRSSNVRLRRAAGGQ